MTDETTHDVRSAEPATLRKWIDSCWSVFAMYQETIERQKHELRRLREETQEFAVALMHYGTPCTSDYEEACGWLVREGFLKPCPPGGCEHYGACQPPPARASNTAKQLGGGE